MPRSSPTNRRTPRRSPEPAARGKKRVLAVIVVACPVLLALIQLTSAIDNQGGTVHREAPVETRGTWTTDDPRYIGRSIQVGPTSVALGRPEDGGVAGRLTIARERSDKGLRVIRLEYETVEGPDALELVPEEQGTMYLRTQPDIKWVRQPEQPSGA